MMRKNGFLAGVGLAAIAACSEGSGGSQPPANLLAPPPAAPTTSSVSSSGSVTGFGSIFINGVRYEFTNGTIVSVEDENDVIGDQSLIGLGVRVRVTATQTNGARVADRIFIDEDLKGPVDSVAPDAANPGIGSFTLVGQTVVVDGNTVFDNDVGDNDGVGGIDIRDLDPANFPVGAPIIVEVSGFSTETGLIATRIDRVNATLATFAQPGVPGDELEVKGFIDSAAADGSSFTINGATFLVSGTVFDDGLAAGAGLVGVFVEVKADINASGDFVAVRVEREDGLDGGDLADEFEIEGVLQSVDTVADPDVIVINGATIEVTDANSLVSQVGNRIEVKGSFNASGILVIREARPDIENSVRIEDRVVGVGGGSFTTRLGLTITPTENSRVEDDTASDGDRLTPAEFLSRLMNDDPVEARGFPENGGVTWARIEKRDDSDRECRLRGPVEAGSISDPTFVIQGVTINTTGLSFNDFEDANDVAIGRAEFFSRLQAGDIVEAKSDDAGAGCANGSLATMTDGEVAFEPDDGVAGTVPPAPPAPPANNDEVAGALRNLMTPANTFTVLERTITVTADTLIDDSIVERARGVELGDADFRFGDLPETLDQLLANGDVVAVQLDAAGNALRIEDR